MKDSSTARPFWPKDKSNAAYCSDESRPVAAGWRADRSGVVVPWAALASSSLPSSAGAAGAIAATAYAAATVATNPRTI